VPVAALIAAPFRLPHWIGLTDHTARAAVTTGGAVVVTLVVIVVGYGRAAEVPAARLSRIWDRLDALVLLAVVPSVLLAQNVFTVLANRF
jgi:hypothetical protein